MAATEVQNAACRSQGSGQCAPICLSHFAATGRCPEAALVWTAQAIEREAIRRPDGPLVARLAACAIVGEIETEAEFLARQAKAQRAERKKWGRTSSSLQRAAQSGPHGRSTPPRRMTRPDR